MKLRDIRRIALKKWPTLTDWALFFIGKKHPIFIEYKMNPEPRYGHGKPPHKILYNYINKNRENYAELLHKFLQYTENLTEIPVDENDPNKPYWDNGFLPGLDGLGIYGYLSVFNPKVYLEIGSGNSTRFARKAINDNGLQTKIISIDPYPRVGVDAICDEVIRKPAETVDVSIYKQLGENDVLFIDNSHYSFTNSDVTVAFLDILPLLNKGVVIEIHDIALPYDYSPEFARRWYQEQYLLACCLLSNPDKYEVILPNAFISDDAELSNILAPLWKHPKILAKEHHGGSFWMRVKS